MTDQTESRLLQWGLKRTAAFLGTNKQVLLKKLKENKPVAEGAPSLDAFQENRVWYFDPEKVKAVAEFLKQHPQVKRAFGRTSDGTKKYSIYIKPEQKAEIEGLFPGIRLVQANVYHKKEKVAEAE